MKTSFEETSVGFVKTYIFGHPVGTDRTLATEVLYIFNISYLLSANILPAKAISGDLSCMN
jgi:hypothetical protein